MNSIESVYEIAKSFMANPQYVTIDFSKLALLSEVIFNHEKPIFPIPEEKNLLKGVVLELVAASVNYCYWYGVPHIRPGNASSTRMYELLEKSFSDFEVYSQFNSCLDNFCRELTLNRFPLLTERINHLNELRVKGDVYTKGMEYCIAFESQYEYECNYNEKYNLNYFFVNLIETFPGFASDIFLKRAFLFFIQLYRRFGWFKDSLHMLYTPADYQVPKVLEHMGCIKYSSYLKDTIYSYQLIPKHSQMECEIRSANIMAIKTLCDLTHWNVADIDAYFFLRRHDSDRPFHLTITTDY
jgi:hypothetical protein